MERTAKGTATAKTSGTTLTISNVAITTNKALVVMVGFDQSQGAPTVKWGNQTLTKLVQRLDSTGGAGAAIYIKEQVWNGRTSDVVITWPSAIGARAALAIETDDFQIEDVEQRNIQAASTTPNTLYSDATAYASEAVWACHVSNGPVEDTAGTPDSGDSPVMTLGQRAGTTGGGFDVTIQEAYAELTSTQQVRSRLTGATSRDWVSVLAAIRGHTRLFQGLTPADLIACEAKFESISKDFEDAAWNFNPVLDRWQVLEDTDMSTVIAHSNDGWA